MHRHNGTDYQHANDCPHCWREASDIQSEAIKSLRAQLAEKERECEWLRTALLAIVDTKMQMAQVRRFAEIASKRTGK